MGEIDAMSRMRDDETEESARIKALCPGLTPTTQLHIATPTVDELFRLCDPARTLRSTMNATTILRICIYTRY